MPDYPVLRTVIARKIIHGDAASRNEGKMMAAELRGILSAFEAAQQGVQPTAFGVGNRGHFANLLISLGKHLVKFGGG